ncbi:transmembrane GTPase Marf [Caerostris darwini]|uniref:Transmembrane GTPase Marf n=1 Tax=Caerostris darwini TaxID=1538125 RepID=A0AAV4VBZ4_9ARAC|nr:transmembrane GTPase Marf [Caerostris darwini]
MKIRDGSSPPGFIDVTSSPLKVFVLAKKKINGIFTDINDCAKETYLFLKESCDVEEVITNEKIQEVYYIQEKIKDIQNVLKRDQMKVVFFGRPSNGKSTVVNALLQDRILPCGMGHTTNCFLQIESSESSEAYVLTENSTEPLNVQSVSQLAHALNSEKFGDSSLIRIFWPTGRCPLLQDDVVLVDSPGIDITPNLDEWIDKHCLDADVFVLVANAESTLMVAEKNFFHKVSMKLSKPNIFVLNNRWDNSVDEKEFIDQIRKQHMDRNVSFLVDELKVVTQSQAEDRIYFVSAKEVLQARIQQQKGKPLISGALADGFQARYFEFQEFERKFQECLSKSAVKTKFGQHTQGGKNSITELCKLLNAVHQIASNLRAQKLSMKKEKKEHLDFTKQQLNDVIPKSKQEICHIIEKVEQKVSRALNEEIRRLHVLVDEFKKPFNSESFILNAYKKELSNHMEQGLGSNLQGKLSYEVQMLAENAEKNMIDKMTSLIPPNHRAKATTALQCENFEVHFHFNCENLCSDFQENLEFKFSLGLINIAKCFLGPNKAKKIFGRIESIPWPVSNTSFPASSEMEVASVSPEYINLFQLALSSSSQSSVGILAVGAFLFKAVGWRVLATVCGIYSLLYAYEKLCWTNKAKERTFKKQYVDHITRKLGLIADLTTSNCSYQVQQKLQKRFSQLCQILDEEISNVQEEIEILDENGEKLEKISVASRTFWNKAHYLFNELEVFSEKYLQYGQ